MELRGIIHRITYSNDSNGYFVGALDTEDEIITLVGVIPGASVGMNIEVRGEFIIDPKYGRQFKVESFSEVMPTTKDGIEKYLSSGVIKGIGPAMARTIVSKFGEDTLRILDEDIDQLKRIRGIGKTNFRTIKESYFEAKGLRNLIMFLQPLGISTNQCLKINLKYGAEAISIIKNNPYTLSQDIKSFGFRRADALATKLGIDRDSFERFYSGVTYALGTFSSQGHTMVPVTVLRDMCLDLLSIDRKTFYSHLKDLKMMADTVLIEKGIGDDVISPEMVLQTVSDEEPFKIGDGSYDAFIESTFREESDEVLLDRQFASLKVMSESEKNVAQRIYELASTEPDDRLNNMEELIGEYEKVNGITLHEKQKEAVTEAIENNLLIITGGPGTGKTTIIKCILYLLERKGEKVTLAAPTGRASKRMTEATGKKASTIHRLLSLKVSEDFDEDDYEEEDMDELVNTDTLIVDEASMIDIVLMNSLLKYIADGTRLILVGDSDQLPSVGPGRVLGDLMDSGVVRVIRLSWIYRQGKESMITTNAHRINEGEMPEVNGAGSDFFFMSSEKSESSLPVLVGLIKERLPSWMKDLDPVKDIQVLSPMRKRAMGVTEINEVLRKELNPEYKEGNASFTEFLLGDKVMQVKNNYNLKGRKTLRKEDSRSEDNAGVFNGDIGYVVSVDEEEKVVTILYDGNRYVDYTPLDLDDVELAYAITIHKSQGSEFPVVIIPVYYGAPSLMTRNLIYTGVTRGRKLVVLIGAWKALSAMIRNNNTKDRFTSLTDRLKYLKENLPGEAGISPSEEPVPEISGSGDDIPF